MTTAIDELSALGCRGRDSGVRQAAERDHRGLHRRADERARLGAGRASTWPASTPRPSRSASWPTTTPRSTASSDTARPASSTASSWCRARSRRSRKRPGRSSSWPGPVPLPGLGRRHAQRLRAGSARRDRSRSTAGPSRPRPAGSRWSRPACFGRCPSWRSVPTPTRRSPSPPHTGRRRACRTRTLP
ncbi:MAG: hypothetical protein KatS3mg114_0900 [Planctomycetaceae bacterium]|nr:MAG: hypothetical protein KatS3mg114_0900 [Planctomycetaceae bacterium]